MRWLGGRESDNVDDRRGGGGGGLLGGGIGVGIIALIVYLLGGDPTPLLRQAAREQRQESHHKTATPRDEEMVRFVKVVLAQTEDVWDSVFTATGSQYQHPTLTLFTNNVHSACGYASAATGPFYCSGDERIYLDLAFFSELKERFNAPGDFANAYVIAHEVGHHVQNLLGTSNKVHDRMNHSGEREANRLSVMLELQADFYAGIWAHYVRERGGVIEDGDIEAAINAAAAVGDDRLQQQTEGRVVPDAFTHGTSAQRMYWFKKGYETGDPRQGNTFKEMSGRELRNL